MIHHRKRVITVAKAREKELHRLGDAAEELFPKNPTSAYAELIKKLNAKGIQFLDRDLLLVDLPDYIAHWYFGRALEAADLDWLSAPFSWD